MILIDLHYIQPLEVVDQFLVAHRDFLREQYALGKLLVSGPKNPREGGYIISLENRAQTEEMIQADPFYRHKIAEYHLTEFEPKLYHDALKAYLS